MFHSALVLGSNNHLACSCIALLRPVRAVTWFYARLAGRSESEKGAPHRGDTERVVIALRLYSVKEQEGFFPVRIKCPRRIYACMRSFAILSVVHC